MRYNPSMEMGRYLNLDQIVDRSMSLDKAELRPMHYYKTEQGIQVPEASRFWGVWNETTHQEICTVGGDYGLVQHADAVNWFISGIQAAGIEGRGIIRNWGNAMKTEVIFDNLQFRDPTGNDSYYVGASLTNSFNKSVGFFVNPFVVRGVCSNGMIFKGRLGKVNKIYVRHIGNVIDRVRDGVKDLVQNMMSVEGTVLKMIDVATNDTITFEKVEDQVLTISKYVNGTRRAKSIVEEYNLPLSITRWDLYNTLTEYATWTNNLPFGVQEGISNNAEEILRHGLKVEQVDPAKLAAALPLSI